MMKPNNFLKSSNINDKFGENDNFLCELIREKKTKDFIVYVNLNHIPLESYIEESFF